MAKAAFERLHDDFGLYGRNALHVDDAGFQKSTALHGEFPVPVLLRIKFDDEAFVQRRGQLGPLGNALNVPLPSLMSTARSTRGSRGTRRLPEHLHLQRSEPRARSVS